MGKLYVLALDVVYACTFVRQVVYLKLLSVSFYFVYLSSSYSPLYRIFFRSDETCAQRGRKKHSSSSLYFVHRVEVKV